MFGKINEEQVTKGRWKETWRRSYSLLLTAALKYLIEAKTMAHLKYLGMYRIRYTLQMRADCSSKPLNMKRHWILSIDFTNHTPQISVKILGINFGEKGLKTVDGKPFPRNENQLHISLPQYIQPEVYPVAELTRSQHSDYVRGWTILDSNTGTDKRVSTSLKCPGQLWISD